MADRYWVGGTATWNATAGSKWSTTSGGASGAAVPTASDDVYFNAASGAVTVTLANGNVARSINCTGFTGTLSHPSSSTVTIGTSTAGAGNIALKFVAGMTYTVSAVSSAITFSSTSSTQQTVDYGGKTVGNQTFTGAGSNWLLASHLASSTTGGALTLTQGTLDAGGYNVTVGVFVSSTSNTRTLTMGSGQWTITGNNLTVMNMGTITNMTLNPSSNPVIFNYSGSTGTRTITPGAHPEASLFSISVTAGTDTINVAAFRSENFDFTGFAGTLGTGAPSIYGNLVLASGMTVGALSNAITFSATSGTQTITTNGVTVDRPITINASGATVSLGGNLTLGSSRLLTVTAGTFNTAGYDITAGGFASTGSTTRVLTLNDTVMTVNSPTTGAVLLTMSGSNATLNAGTSKVVVPIGDASATRSVAFGDGYQWYDFEVQAQAASSILTVTGGSSVDLSFHEVKVTGYAYLRVTTGTDIFAALWDLNGSSGNVVSIESTTGTNIKLHATGQHVVECDYCYFADVSVLSSNGTTWFVGPNSTSGSDTVGLRFEHRPPNMLPMLLDAVGVSGVTSRP